MQNLINEDDRRLLYSFPEGKMLYIKKDCIVGKHYHKIKTEYFILSKGKCLMIIDGKKSNMVIGKLYQINPLQLHEFNIKGGSVLIGLNSHPYNPEDDYK